MLFSLLLLLLYTMVGPRKAESQMAEEKKAEKNMAEKDGFQHLAEYTNGRISKGRMLKWPKLAESRASGPSLARARFSPLALDLANFPV
jgi:hypothetical protein